MHRPHSLLSIFAPLAILTTAATCIAQDTTQPRRLSFWTVGSGGETERFGDDLYETLDRERSDIEEILLAIAEGPRSEEELRESTTLSGDRLRELLTTLESLNIVRLDADRRWATTLPVITDHAMQSIRESLIPLADAVAREMGRRMPALTAAYDSIRRPDDPPWSDVAHLLVDKFLVDGSFHVAIERLEQEGTGPRLSYDRSQQILPAFFLERGESFSTFGSNWYPYRTEQGQREVYVLHGAVFQRYDIRMNAYRGDDRLASALFAIPPSGSIEALPRDERRVLGELGWTRDDRLLVPVIRAATIKSMLPMLDDVGAAGAEIVMDRYSVIADAYRGSPYARFLSAGGDYAQVCYHALFGLVLEKMAENGSLPSFPRPVPEDFGVFIIVGKVF